MKTIFALGFFDGVHLGHAALLRQCRLLADEHGCKAGVVTFDTHPRMQVLGSSPALISSVRERERLLRDQFHMDTVLTLPFDEKMRAKPWQDFLRLLREEHGAAGFVCGEDFRFGCRGSGNAPLLSDYCGQNRIPCSVVPDQTIDGVRVSSTYIREKIESGDMQTAVRFLGHPYTVRGEVIHGQGLGRTIGIPTANLRLPEELVVPGFGVYACRARAEGRCYPAVTYVGTRPTVAGSGVSVETWIPDYSGDLYGKELTVEFYCFLRPERKFPSLEALREEIRRNEEQTRALLQRTFTQ